MSGSEAEFEREIKKFILDVEKLTEDTFKKIAIDADAALVMGTPVDTGRARGNWLPSINETINEPIDREDKSGEMTVAEAAAVIETAKLGDIIHLQNNVPYIGRLNDGHSAQAPAGFVEDAVERVISPIRK